MLAFGVLTGAGLRPLLNMTIRVNPSIIPTAIILSSGLSDLTLYGGVVVMSGFVCYDTQMICARYEMGDRDFIYHSLDLFVDFISLFRKLLIILTKKEENNKRRRN